MDGILIIDKPAGMTSHDVVNILRRKYKQKKFGHTGTLDPQATGVLVVLCGRACKALQFLQDTDKEYIGQVQFGYSTTTDDIWGEKLESKPLNTNFNFKEELDKFLGKQNQLVPKTSNKKVNGMKLMDYQRKGLKVPEVYTDIEIYSIEELSDYKFKVSCSSGTYVRSICRDLALNTNNLGCMSYLRRTKVGRFSIEQAYTLEQLDQVEPVLYSTKEVLDHLEMIEYTNIDDVYQGKRIQLDTLNNLVCITQNKEPVAIYERESDCTFKSKRGLW